MFGQASGGGFGGFGASNPGTTGSVFGSGGGFGQPNQQQGTGPGFGTGGAFGTNTGPGFGSTPTFGGTTTGGGFGTTNAFGAKPAFGATTTSGGLFGSNTATTGTTGGFGGFGSNTTTPGFGAANTTGGGMFGAQKPAFGAPPTTGATGGGLFGTAAPTTTTPAFGATGTGQIGFGGTDTLQPPLNGTATTPYTTTQEKELNSSVTNHFQTISFMPAYKNWSLEELRLQDYATGRRYGNSAGQTGAFGFSAFGNTNTPATTTAGFGAGAGGGMFGNTGQNQQQTGGFGATTGGFGATSNTPSGGLFGQKPATAGLFGASNTGTIGGGLFGSNTGTTGGFGTTGTTTGTGAFGSNTSGAFGAATQAKPANGFSFGGTTSTPTAGGFGTNTGTGFGTTNTGTTGGGLFGQQPPQQQQQTPAFGAQPATTGFGPGAFGQSQPQQQQTTGFGGFGAQQQQQQKPAFGFGTTTTTPATGGGLFGNQQQTQQPQQQQTQTGGLFGSKPAFGGTATTGTTGGGLFGTTQTQQTGGGLFGSNQPAATTTGGGLFGPQSNTGTTGGGGLFQSSSLFGTQQPQQQQQQQGGGLFASAIGQQNQQQQQFTTSISDSPYGNTALLGSLGVSAQGPVGPIATPLNATQNKKAAMIPHHKIAPRQPALTPRLGTSFTKTGSPFASSSAGAALGSGGSFRQSLSTNNRLSLFDGDDTVLNASAFSSGTSRIAGLKKLVIDKKIRDQGLFNDDSEPHVRAETVSTGRGSANNQKGILKKTVSFDVNEKRDEDLFASPGSSDTAVKATNGPAPSSDELGYIRRTPERRRATDDEFSPASTPGAPQNDSAAGNELALVPVPKDDKEPGSYWMVPSAQKLKSLSQEQRKKLHGLTVGRRGYGSVRFENPVDVTEIECKIEEIPGKLVIFEPRVCTVYPEEMSKPAPGTGLNVPALISLEECFPLTKNQREKIVDPEHPRYITHIKRLRSIKDTEFVDYQPQSGLWIFKVRHFTTYGLVDSDEEMDEQDVAHEEDASYVTEEGQTPTPRPAIVTPASLLIDDEDTMDADISGVDSSSGLDDTFDFKRLPKATGALARGPPRDQHPGSFLDETDASYEYDDGEGDVTMDGEPFLGEGSVGSIEEEEEPAEPASEDEMVEDEGQLTVIAEEDEDEDTTGVVDDTPRKQIMMSSPERSPAKSIGATPKALPMGRDWTEQLNNTISPVKRRFGGESFFAAVNKSASPRKSTMEPLNYGLLDLANDLYGSPTKLNGSVRKDMSKTRKRDQFESSPSGSRYGFESIRIVTKKPLASSIRSDAYFDHHALDTQDLDWRKAVRPCWGPEGMIIYMGQLEALRVRKNEGSLSVVKVNSGTKMHVVPKPLQQQLRVTDIRLDEFGIPYAEIKLSALFQSFAELAWSFDPKDQHERSVWKLASVLWDPLTDVTIKEDVSAETARYMREQKRKQLLSRFFEELVEQDADRHAQLASTAEEAAFAHLTAHRVEEACSVLVDAHNFRIATLLPMLGGDKTARETVRKQLEHWRNKGVLSELSIPIRVLYELLSGETCSSEGVKSPAEDVAATFFIAQHFGLDWKRAVALKYWYGIFEEEGIGRLVQCYEDDLNRYPDKVSRPKPWYLSAHDDAPDAIDILWGLLKIYATDSLNLEDVFAPANFGPNKIDYRLAWQLRVIFSRLGIRDFTGSTSSPDGVGLVAGSRANQLTTDFAGGLENAGLWEWALFVLLHVQDADARGAAIKNLIGRHVDELEDVEKLNFLESMLRVPRPWIYEAKALQARSAGNHLLEAEYLITAKAWVEAHRTIIQQVAPAAIISGNLDNLKKILAKFEPSVQPEGWGLGGQVYLDYIRLLELSTRDTPKARDEKREVALRLLSALKNVERHGFLQNIAVREMAGVVGSFVVKLGDVTNEKTKVLELPLTEDQYLKKTVNLSLEFYKAKLKGIAV